MTIKQPPSYSPSRQHQTQQQPSGSNPPLQPQLTTAPSLAIISSNKSDTEKRQEYLYIVQDLLDRVSELRKSTWETFSGEALIPQLGEANKSNAVMNNMMKRSLITDVNELEMAFKRAQQMGLFSYTGAKPK